MIYSIKIINNKKHKLTSIHRDRDANNLHLSHFNSLKFLTTKLIFYILFTLVDENKT